MIRNFCVLITAALVNSANAMPVDFESLSLSIKYGKLTDTIDQQISKESLDKFINFRLNFNSIDTVNVKQAQLQTFTNLASIVQSQVSGVYVQKPTGEPGAYQNIIIRGRILQFLITHCTIIH